MTFSDNLREAACSSILLDIIDGLGGTIGHQDLPKESAPLDHNPESIQSTAMANIGPTKHAHHIRISAVDDGCSALLSAVSRCLSLDRHDRYLRHAAPRDRYLQTFLTLCQATVENAEGATTGFTTWFDVNRSLSIRGRTLEEAVVHVAKHDSSVSTRMRAKWRHIVRKEEPELEKDVEMVSGSDGLVDRMEDTTMRRQKRLMVTNTGLLGMAPPNATKGDCICILLGCSIPLILRPVGPNKGSYRLVGECYVDGYMNGEVFRELSSGRLTLENIRLV